MLEQNRLGSRDQQSARSRPSGKLAALRVGAALGILDEIAPLSAAEPWDNVGLLAGRAEWPARRWLLALDLTDAVAREALRTRAELLVVYHPPIFKGIRAVTADAAAPTSLLPDLLAARVSIIALHTALDVASPGTNDVLLDLFDTIERRPLQPSVREPHDYKLVVFAPAGDVARLREALAAAGAGTIGHYSQCSFELRGHGTFLGDKSTRPSVGGKQRLELVEESRLEMVAPRSRLSEIVRALYATHSYEEPAFDIYPRSAVERRGATGLGRVGTLRKAVRGGELISRLRGSVDLSAAQVVGDVRRKFESVTAAAGAFDAGAFRDPRSLVLTGEMKHHAALDLIKRGVAAIALGHYASERPALEWLAKRLQSAGCAVKIARADGAALRPISTGD